jgi:hypothetical protein
VQVHRRHLLDDGVEPVAGVELLYLGVELLVSIV